MFLGNMKLNTGSVESQSEFPLGSPCGSNLGNKISDLVFLECLLIVLRALECIEG